MQGVALLSREHVYQREGAQTVDGGFKFGPRELSDVQPHFEGGGAGKEGEGAEGRLVVGGEFTARLLKDEILEVGVAVAAEHGEGGVEGEDGADAHEAEGVGEGEGGAAGCVVEFLPACFAGA